ncbi:inorganic pyrophosphatase 1-like [Lolium perenne]|uniref:inorganic pyrophosphatase 1-like n=1 Tax=Lolium perenne TaxID=4522 RepID=UPI003A9939AB
MGQHRLEDLVETTADQVPSDFSQAAAPYVPIPLTSLTPASSFSNGFYKLRKHSGHASFMVTHGRAPRRRRDAALRGPCSASLAAAPSIGHVDGLGATELFDRLLPTMPWNTLIDTVMGELHARGKTLHNVAEVLRAVPIDPHVVAAIKAAYGLGCDLRVLCDANLFFIETILNHHGLRGYFSEINTNPSHVDADGRLRIAPHHDYHAGPHGSGLGTCPPNMCKGQVLDRTRVGISSNTLSAVVTKTLSAAAGLGIGVC